MVTSDVQSDSFGYMKWEERILKKFYNSDGFAHVIARGVGKMIIYEDEMDYKYYIKLIRKYAEQLGITVCAYCLMANHVHILVRYSGENIAKFMQRLNSVYAKYFNKKYDRVGHLFQGLYRMENVETASYFLTVTRYIIQNPEKAGICKAYEYRWSSLHDFDSPKTFVDISVAVGMLGGYDKFYQFVNVADAEELSIEFDDLGKMMESDEVASKGEMADSSAELIEKVKLMLELENVSEINDFSREKRNAALAKMRDEGLSIREIARVTGFGRNIIQRAK